MIDSIDDLLRQYELGTISRREILAAIALLLAPPQSSAQDGIFKARALNHVNVRVTDLARSEAFYRKVLGFPAVRPVQGAAFALDFPGGGAISLCPLSAAGFDRVRRAGTSVFVNDPDGTPLQLSSVDETYSVAK